MAGEFSDDLLEEGLAGFDEEVQLCANCLFRPAVTSKSSRFCSNCRSLGKKRIQSHLARLSRAGKANPYSCICRAGLQDAARVRAAFLTCGSADPKKMLSILSKPAEVPPQTTPKVGLPSSSSLLMAQERSATQLKDTNEEMEVDFEDLEF